MTFDCFLFLFRFFFFSFPATSLFPLSTLFLAHDTRIRFFITRLFRTSVIALSNVLHITRQGRKRASRLPFFLSHLFPLVSPSRLPSPLHQHRPHQQWLHMARHHVAQSGAHHHHAVRRATRIRNRKKHRISQRRLPCRSRRLPCRSRRRPTPRRFPHCI